MTIPTYVGVLLLVLAALLGSCGLCAMMGYWAVPFVAPPNLETNVLLGILAGIGILFGAGVAWQGVLIVRGREAGTSARAIPPFGIFIGAFFIAVLIGISILSFKQSALVPVVLAFPVVHFIAATSPVFAVIAYAARRLGKASSARAAWLALGWGAFGSTTVAIIVETILGLLFVLFVVVVLMMQPNGTAELNRLPRILQSVARANDFSVLMQWLANPYVIAGVLFYFALLVPMIEEVFKAGVLAFMDSQRTLVRDAVLWGICAGAGFALIENLLNAVSAGTNWGVIILMRAGTAMIHMANGAWMGRGWYAARVERRWGQLVQTWLWCVMLHAIWNGAVLVMTGGTFVLNTSQAIVPASVLIAVMATVLFILTLVSLGSIVYLVRRSSV